MNRESLLPAGAAPTPAIIPRHQVLLRELLLRVLRRAREGRFVLREQGIIVAAIGAQGHELHAEVDVLDTRLYARVLLGGDTAAAEAYMDGW